MSDTERQLAAIVSGAIKVATAPLLARIALLEQRTPQIGPSGPAGAKGDTGSDGLQGPAGRDGKDADVSVLMAMKADIAAMQGEWAAFKTWQADALTKAAAGQPIVQGLSVDDVKPFITAEVAAAVKALPAPEPGPVGPMGPAGHTGPGGRDGIDGKPGADGAPGRDGIDGKSGADGLQGPAGRDGKDGVGISDALIDRKGHLVLTLTDGGTKDVGPVMGKDGRDGETGLIGPSGKDGRDGVDGVDGLGFDDMDIVFDETKGYQVVFTRGEHRKAFPMYVPWYGGTYESGKLYRKGVMVTDRGAMWTAITDTRARPPKPNEPRLSSCEWRLAVKPGRDGRDREIVKGESS